MHHIVSIHSYRGGTGKSNVTANVAWLAARRGKRVAVLDTDLQSPGVHFVLGLEKDRISHTLTDFLHGKCALEEAAYDMTAALAIEGGGALHLLPSSMKIDAIMRIVSDGYDVGRLNTHFKTLIEALHLDILFVDTHPGMNRETMLTTAISDTLVVLIRPDTQDFHGTAVMVEVAGRLGVPRCYMVANKVVSRLDREEVRRKIRDAFQYEVIGILPLDEDMATLGSRGLFAQRHPGHPLAVELAAIADRILADFAGDGR